MNSRLTGRRRTLAVLCSTATVAGIGGWAAVTAIAAGETLAFGPTATSATITNVAPGASSTAAGLSYGVKITGASSGDTDPLYAQVLTGPTNGEVYVQRRSGNTAPAADASATVLNAAASTVSAASASATSLTLDANAVPATGSYLLRLGTGASALYVAGTVTNGSTAITLSTPLPAAVGAGTAIAHMGLMSANPAVFTPVPVNSAFAVPGYSTSGADNVYFGATDAGTYTLRLFKDHNGDGAYQAAQDDTTPTFTLTVKDVTNQTSSDATDDLSFGLSVASSVDLGQPVTANATLGGLTLIDTRGTSAGKAVLGTNLAAATYFDGTATTVTAGADSSPTFDGTKFTHSFTTSGAAGSFDIQPQFDSNASASFSGADYTPTAQKTTTTVASNGVTVVGAVTSTDVTGESAYASNATTIKTGVSTVQYKVTLTDAGTKTDDVVYFTLTPTTNTPTLTASGTMVSDTSGVKVYSVTADADGVAKLDVTSSLTTATTAYTVSAKSNAVNSTNTVTATYAAPAATTAAVVSTKAELTNPVTATSVTVKGKLLDQYGAAYQPTAGLSQQAQLFTGTTASGCSAYSFAGGVATNTAVANATITAGQFTFTYTPGSTPTAGHCTPIGIGFDLNGNGTVAAAGEPIVVEKLNWASTSAASSVTFTSPNADATKVNLSDHSTIAPGQSTASTGATAGAEATDFGDTAGQITGVVKDAANAVMPYKTVTLTATDGVYFSDSNTGSSLVNSIDVVTDGSGVFSGAYAFFTKVGTAKVTATVGSVTKEISVTTDSATDVYIVGVDDVSGEPGSTLVVTGMVKDMFGNMVPGATVSLSTGTSTIGTLAATSVTTNAEGIFSTTYTAGSNKSGEVTLTATINGGVTDGTPAGTWSSVAKMTGLASGKNTDTGTISVAEEAVVLNAPAMRTGVGSVTVSGTAKAGATVELYGKAAGSDADYGLRASVKADDDGAWSKSLVVGRSMTWLAKSNGKSSDEATTTVKSSVKLTTTALGKNRVRLYIDGNPNAAVTATFYRMFDNGKMVKVATVKTNSLGQGAVVVKAPRGSRSYLVYYTAPGTNRGYATAKVMVK